MASITPPQPQQRAPMNNAIPQQHQAQQPQPQSQHQVQVQAQLQYAPQHAQAPVATFQQPQVVRSPTLSRKPVGQKAAIPGNATPSPASRPVSVASAPLAQQQHAHVQGVSHTAHQQQQSQQFQRIQTATPNVQVQTTQNFQGHVVQRPIQTQHQPLQQPQHAQQRPQIQALQQLQQTHTPQHSQSAGAVLNTQHVQQINEAKPPLPRRTTVPALQPQQIQQQQQPPQQQRQHQQSQQQPQQQQSINQVSAQISRPYSTTSTGPHSVSSGPSVMTPSTGPTTPGTPNLTNPQWQQAQPPSNTARSIQQQHVTSTIFCNHCKTGIPSNVSTYTCLICSTAHTLTSFCVWCFTSGAAATSHPHDKAYYVNESDMRVQLAPTSGVPTHLWTVKRNVTGTFWYTHNATGYKTHIKPHGSIVGSTGLPPGWAERRTPDGRTFFFNSTTRATSWVRPVNSLPPGWRELRTPDFVPYYVHDGMALAAWERPGQQPKGRRSSMMSRPGASNAGDSLKKMWGKLGKTQNLAMMTRLAVTASNMADGNVQSEDGFGDGGFGDAAVDGGPGAEYTGQNFGGGDQQDVQTDVYADNAGFQQANFATQEQPSFTEASDATQQPIYEQPAYEQPIYEQSAYQQPVHDQTNVPYQQPLYETGQQPPLMEGLAQSPLANDTSYVLQQPQPDPSQFYVNQDSLGATPEQEISMQSQIMPDPGTLENPYQTTVQQELMLNQPTASLAQSQALLMYQILQSTTSTEQPALGFAPEEQTEVSITPGEIAQDRQQYIVNYEETVAEAENNMANNTAQLMDNSQLVASLDQASAESNLTVDVGQYNALENEQQILVDNAQLTTANELQSMLQANIVDSAGTSSGVEITEPAQLQAGTNPAATVDISSLSGGLQAMDISAQDAASRPNVATEPVSNPSLEQKGAEYSIALI